MADSSYILYSVITAGLFSQGLKILFIIFRHKQAFHIKDFFITGSMPSTHSSLVSALALSIFLSEGISTAFAASLVLALIVIRDAMGVRRSVGEEGKIINKIIKAARIKLPEMHYALGHTFTEVFVGIIIGIASSIAVYYLI